MLFRFSYISGSYTGITGVGTLTAGTWNATTIAVGYGGTGLTTYSVGDLIYASGATTLSKLALGTSTYVLVAGATAPEYVAQSTLSVGSAATATSAGYVANAVTFNNSGSGATSGTTYDGSAVKTISYNTIGAPSVSGTNATGTWGIDISGNAATATSATTATNATNVATTATSTNANFYIPFVAAATTGNQALGVDAGITYNPSTNAITAGISGGTF